LRVVGPEQMSEIGPPGAGRRQRLCPRLPTARAPTRGETAQSLLHPEIGGEEDVRIAESAHADVSVAPGSDPRQGEESAARLLPIAAGAEVEASVGQRRRQRADRTDPGGRQRPRSEEHTSELQSRFELVCRLLLEKNND